MASKSVSRTLLEKFYGGVAGANAVMHATIEADILKNELQKRLTWWEYRWVLQDITGAESPEKILYARLARLLTRQEMEVTHDRIHNAFEAYLRDLEANRLKPR